MTVLSERCNAYDNNNALPALGGKKARRITSRYR